VSTARPDLRELVARFKGHENITPEAWAAFDAQRAAWDAERKDKLRTEIDDSRRRKAT
jgi:hypothetical protein